MCEKARVGCFKRTASKPVYYLWWNRSPAQVGYMTQVLGPGTLGRPRGIGQRGRWEWGSGWGVHLNTWLFHVNVWQNPLQYCKVISLQNNKNKLKKKKNAMVKHPREKKITCADNGVKKHPSVSVYVSSVTSVVSDSLWPHGLQPTRLLCPWGSPGKNIGIGCHALLHWGSSLESNPCLLHLLHWLLSP